MSADLSQTSSISGRIVLLQILTLAALSLLVFRSEIAFVVPRLIDDSEAAHAFAAPVLIALLVLCRRDALLNALAPGSPWGLVVLIGAALLYSLSSWPFNYGYPRQVAFVPAIAGCILAVGGWRVLKLCLPMLLILALSIPLGHRQYAGLIVRTETVTLQIAEQLLSALPGVIMSLQGSDLHYLAQGRSGIIGLGDPHRGASLFLSFLTIGAFVAFVRIRPMWQLIVLGVAALPIVLASNLVRLLLHGVLTIYGGYTPLSPVPRTLSAALALLFAYGAFAFVIWVMRNAIVPADDASEKHDSRRMPA